MMNKPISITITSFDEQQRLVRREENKEKSFETQVIKFVMHKGNNGCNKITNSNTNGQEREKNEYKKLPLGRSYSLPPGNKYRHLQVPSFNKMHKTKVVSMGTQDIIGGGDNTRHVTYYPDRKLSDSWIGSADINALIESPKTSSNSTSINEKDHKKETAKSLNGSSQNHSKKPKLLSLDRKLIPSIANAIHHHHHHHKKEHPVVVVVAVDENKKQQEQPPLQETAIREMIQDFFTGQLEGVDYCHEHNEERSVHFSKKIHDRLRKMTGDRFKFVVSVFMGEIRDEGMETSSQCVWDPKQDCVVMGYYKNNSLFAIAVVFAIALD